MENDNLAKEKNDVTDTQENVDTPDTIEEKPTRSDDKKGGSGKNKKKWIIFVAAGLAVILLAVLIPVLCIPKNDDNSPQDTSQETEGKSITEDYSAYVDFIKNKGATPLGYETWLAKTTSTDGKLFIGLNGNWWIGDTDTKILSTLDEPQKAKLYELYQTKYSYEETLNQWIIDFNEDTLSTQWTVSLDADNGTDILSYKVTKNKTFSAPDAPEKTGYTFSGWYDSDDVLFDFKNIIVADIGLQAKWIPNQYTLSLYNGETLFDELNVTFGDEYTLPTLSLYYDVISVNSYYLKEFLGWAIPSEGEESILLDLTGIWNHAKDITATASWQATLKEGTPPTALAAPELTVSDTTIYWGTVRNADKYLCTIYDEEGKVVETKTLAAGNRRLTVQMGQSVTVVALAPAGGKYLNSAPSNKVTAMPGFFTKLKDLVNNLDGVLNILNEADDFVGLDVSLGAYICQNESTNSGTVHLQANIEDDGFDAMIGLLANDELSFSLGYADSKFLVENLYLDVSSLKDTETVLAQKLIPLLASLYTLYNENVPDFINVTLYDIVKKNVVLENIISELLTIEEDEDYFSVGIGCGAIAAILDLIPNVDEYASYINVVSDVLQNETFLSVFPSFSSYDFSFLTWEHIKSLILSNADNDDGLLKLIFTFAEDGTVNGAQIVLDVSVLGDKNLDYEIGIDLAFFFSNQTPVLFDTTGYTSKEIEINLGTYFEEKDIDINAKVVVNLSEMAKSNEEIWARGVFAVKIGENSSDALVYVTAEGVFIDMSEIFDMLAITDQTATFYYNWDNLIDRLSDYLLNLVSDIKVSAQNSSDDSTSEAQQYFKFPLDAKLTVIIDTIVSIYKKTASNILDASIDPAEENHFNIQLIGDKDKDFLSFLAQFISLGTDTPLTKSNLASHITTVLGEQEYGGITILSILENLSNHTTSDVVGNSIYASASVASVDLPECVGGSVSLTLQEDEESEESYVQINLNGYLQETGYSEITFDKFGNESYTSCSDDSFIEAIIVLFNGIATYKK